MERVFIASVSRNRRRQWAVVLQDMREGLALVVPVRTSEAESIASGLALDDPNPPQVHDLLLEVIEAIGAELQRVVITNFTEQGNFRARIEVQHNSVTIDFPARLGDALALAARADAEILVAPQVLAKAGVPIKGSRKASSEAFKELLGDLAFKEPGNGEQDESA